MTTRVTHKAGILRRGDQWIWLTGSALGTCLMMIFALIYVILTNGLGFFWPAPVEKVTLRDGTVFAGQLSQSIYTAKNLAAAK